MKASYWAHGESKLVIVTNFGRQPAVGMLTFEGGRPTALEDAETGERVVGERGTFRAQVPARSFRLLKTRVP